MPQVLEAPQVQDEAREPMAIRDGHSAAQPSKQPPRLLHVVISALTRLRPQPLRACADTAAPYESAVDRICRTDPYLYLRAMSG
ncbi:hypothetical protein [Candidatus Entotheonella palauensis]|uniref:hypothetical protein n=1 Tax=Candidatus Entotheonella palauensis TaxID=93172 RepID=UPI000B7DA8AC|nr:hypothetical protein [Candidatus Entotheonella palauensis]